jgi:hypothetical protein
VTHFFLHLSTLLDYILFHGSRPGKAMTVPPNVHKECHEMIEVGGDHGIFKYGMVLIEVATLTSREAVSHLPQSQNGDSRIRIERLTYSFAPAGWHFVK